MSSNQARIDTEIGKITSLLPANNLPECIREEMKKEPIFQTIFGPNMERVKVNEVTSYNDSALPLLEMNWKSDRPSAGLGRATGSLDCRFIFPNNLSGLFNVHRKVIMAWLQVIENRCSDIFPKVPGLIAVGADPQVQYGQMLLVGAMRLPLVTVDLDFLLDLQRFRSQNEAFDSTGTLDGEVFGYVEFYKSLFGNEDKEVLIETETVGP